MKRPPARARTARAPSTRASSGAAASVLAGAVAAARAVRVHAHAPYSRFQVGAAVVDERGRLHVGCNIENASYGLTTCAERNAIAAAVAAGAQRITAVAVVTDANPLASPCGACRQVMAEFADPAAVVILAAARGERTVAHTVGGLLPDSFTFER
jgi:cytidine deaminase